MTTAAAPADQNYRLRIRDHLDENLFVEAGAGTGKTTALVSRITSLIASGRTEMSGLAAITFTEAAASELRERVRRELEKEAREGQEADERRRCGKAAREMELASIQTLHSFALSLLRELALDAGMPPVFDTLDAIQADLGFQEAWEKWLDQALDSDELGPRILRALSLGLGLANLRQVAAALHQDYDLVQQVPFPEAPLPSLTIVPQLAEAASEVDRLLPLAKNGPSDVLYAHALTVADLARRIQDAGEEASIALLTAAGTLSTTRGAQGNWETDPVSGVNGCKYLKDLFDGLEKVRVRELEHIRLAALLPLLQSVRRFVLEQVEHRKTEGRAEFHDLLVWARDMLRDNSRARRHFQRRFSNILIDEFQDTDPIQAEIAFFLAGNPDDLAAGETADWRAVPPVPGKLFVVGDPKQSIYRFRRADISALEDVRGQLTQESVPLVQNFRSQTGVIDWVNHVFRQWMTGADPAGGGPVLQADYQDLSAWWAPPDATPPLGVHRIGGQVDGPAAQVRRQESLAIAALARQVKAEPWQVRDGNSGELRDAEYRDICLLMPARTILGPLEQALEDADVPYRIESESLVLATEDVRDLLNCLRAIDSPADQVALVAALRSSALACSDAELLRFVDDGGRFDYFNPGAASGPVADGLAVLRKFHDVHSWTLPDELIERFIRDRRMIESSFARRRPRERWRRLRFVVEQATAFLHAGGSSLRGFLDWMDRQVSERARTVESPVPETDEDCVRIMTIHAAKGLEFPIVMLTGLGSNPQHRANPVVINRATGRAEVRIPAAGESHFQTAGFEAAAELEKAAGDAEAVRLAYVACTRAKDHLVLSVFRGKAGAKSPAAQLEQYCAAAPGLWREIDTGSLVGAVAVGTPTGAPSSLASPDDFAQRREVWQEQRNAIIARAGRPRAQGVTAIARLSTDQAKDQAEEGEVSYRRGRGGTNLGRAVHAVLQTVDLTTGDRVEETCIAQAAAEGIPESAGQVELLARNALRSRVVREMVAGADSGQASYYREVFVSAPLGGVLVEGFIDLLIDGPGGLTIVDYKTDDVNAGGVSASAAQYRKQVGLYAWAVGEVTGKPVREAVLLYLRPDVERIFHDVDELLAEARAAVASAA